MYRRLHHPRVGVYRFPGNSVTENGPRISRALLTSLYGSNSFFLDTCTYFRLCKRPEVKILSEFRDQFTYFWIFFEKLGQIFDRNPLSRSKSIGPK